ncbi:MAG TPA: response regulator [Methyloceanibacter sp.]|nr:response regulator [Methyloceanibacter sp.]
MNQDARGGAEPLPVAQVKGAESEIGNSLSSDYLNHYVEVLMLIEMAPNDSSLSADLNDWWPKSYLDWFSASQLQHASQARAAYEALPNEKRRRFERLVSVMETLATMAVFALQPPCQRDRAAVVVEATAPVLRNMIGAASAFLDSGGRQYPDEQVVRLAEEVIDIITSAHSEAATSAHATPEAAKPHEPRSTDGVAAAAGTRILIVEDDALLRELFRKALRRAGYDVLTAESGEKALSVLREWGERIDWLFTDVRLPGRVNGWVVGSEFSLNHPLRPVVYGSGYEPDGSRQVANSVFLRKPVNLGELVAAFKGLSATYHRHVRS